MDLIVEVGRYLAYASLMLLPGVWFGFSRLCAGMDGWLRLLLSLAVAPLIGSVQFLVLQAVGVAPEPAVFAVAIVNVPALTLIFRANAPFAIMERRRLLVWLSLAAIPLVLIFFVQSGAGRPFPLSHPGLHTDQIHALLASPFDPEEMHLAGVRAAYPWFGHIQYVMLSVALDVSPMFVAYWVNPVQFIILAGMIAAIVRHLGGGWFAIASSTLLVAIAVHPLGNAIRFAAQWDLFDVGLLSMLPGDRRYALTVLKYAIHGLNKFGLTLSAALMAVLICRTKEMGAPALAAAASVVTVTLGLIYPLFLPYAVGLIGARCTGLLLPVTSTPVHERRREILWLGVAAIVSTGLVLAYVGYAAAARESGFSAEISSLRSMAKEVVLGGFALSLPILAAVYVGRHLWQTQDRLAVIILSLAIVGAYALYVVLYIRGVANQYKFVSLGAIAGTPMLAIAAEKLVSALDHRRMLAAGLTVLAVVVGTALSFGLAEKIARMPDEVAEKVPLVHENGIVRLGEGQALAAVADTIRSHTPTNTVVVAGDLPIHLPPYTKRALYAPYNSETITPTLGFPNGMLLTYIKGYPAALLQGRQATLTKFYAGESGGAERQAALAEVLALNRPVAVLTRDAADERLEAWLRDQGTAKIIMRNNGYSVWLFETAASQSK